MTMNNGLIIFRCAVLMMLLTTVTPGWAATITVTTLDDVNAVDCTLRDAIQAANTNGAFLGCTAGDSGQDTIRFNVSGVINLSYPLGRRRQCT